RTQMLDLQPGMARHRRQQQVPGILVHHDDLKIPVALLLEAAQEVVEFGHAMEGGNDERDHGFSPDSYSRLVMQGSVTLARHSTPRVGKRDLGRGWPGAS